MRPPPPIVQSGMRKLPSCYTTAHLATPGFIATGRRFDGQSSGELEKSISSSFEIEDDGVDEEDADIEVPSRLRWAPLPSPSLSLFWGFFSCRTRRPRSSLLCSGTGPSHSPPPLCWQYEDDLEDEAKGASATSNAQRGPDARVTVGTFTQAQTQWGTRALNQSPRSRRSSQHHQTPSTSRVSSRLQEASVTTHPCPCPLNHAAGPLAEPRLRLPACSQDFICWEA